MNILGPGPTGPQGITGPQGPEAVLPFSYNIQFFQHVIISSNTPYTVPINTSMLQPGTYMVLFNAYIAREDDFNILEVSIQYNGFNTNYTNTTQFPPNTCSTLSEHSTHLFTKPGTPTITFTANNTNGVYNIYIQFILLE